MYRIASYSEEKWTKEAPDELNLQLHDMNLQRCYKTKKNMGR